MLPAPACRAAVLALALCASVAAAGARPEPRAVTPRGPLGPAEQSVVRLFEAAAPSVAYVNTERVQLTGRGSSRFRSAPRATCA